MTCPTITQNEGVVDRAIRVVLGSIAVVAAHFWLTGVEQTLVYGISFVLLVTGLVGFCGLYTFLGISTVAPKKK